MWYLVANGLPGSLIGTSVLTGSLTSLSGLGPAADSALTLNVYSVFGAKLGSLATTSRVLEVDGLISM